MDSFGILNRKGNQEAGKNSKQKRVIFIEFFSVSLRNVELDKSNSLAYFVVWILEGI